MCGSEHLCSIGRHGPRRGRADAGKVTSGASVPPSTSSAGAFCYQRLRGPRAQCCEVGGQCPGREYSQRGHSCRTAFHQSGYMVSCGASSGVIRDVGLIGGSVN